MTGGGWSPAPHVRAEEMLADKGKLRAFAKAIETRGLGDRGAQLLGQPT